MQLDRGSNESPGIDMSGQVLIFTRSPPEAFMKQKAAV